MVSQSVEPSAVRARPSPGGRALRAAVGLSPERITELYARALEGEGPALLPVPAGTPEARVRELLESMRPDSVLTPEGRTRLEGGTPAGEDTALVLTTSGSTGAPKGVELSSSALLASARASVERIGAGPEDSWLCVLPAGHISGLQVITRALAVGTEPVHAPFDVGGVAHLAERLNPHVSLVPTQLVMMDGGRVVADGDPHEVVTSDRVGEVFGLACDVVPDPRTGTPLVIPHEEPVAG